MAIAVPAIKYPPLARGESVTSVPSPLGAASCASVPQMGQDCSLLIPDTASCQVTDRIRMRIVASVTDRKSVVSGKSVSVRVDLGGRRILKKKKNRAHTQSKQKKK